MSRHPVLTEYVAAVLSSGGADSSAAGPAAQASSSGAGAGGLRSWLAQRLVEKVVVAVVAADGHSTLETFVFEIDLPPDDTARLDAETQQQLGDAAAADMAAGLRDFMLRLAESGGRLQPLPPGCSFSVVVHTNGVRLGGGGGGGRNTSQQAAAAAATAADMQWMEAVGLTEQRDIQRAQPQLQAEAAAAAADGVGGRGGRGVLLGDTLPTLVPLKTLRSRALSLQLYALEHRPAKANCCAAAAAAAAASATASGGASQ
eukprot:SAG22_NODE_2467_length_2539_cov_7.170082_1_plen_259_part_00